MNNQIFVENWTEKEEFEMRGWTCEECEGGWMCFRYYSDAVTWLKQK